MRVNTSSSKGAKRPRPEQQQHLPRYQQVASSRDSLENPDNVDSLDSLPHPPQLPGDTTTTPIFEFNLSTLSYAFVGMGILNNAPYVVMLAAAKTMAQGGVAVVYVANIVPGLLVKTTLPYLMERVTYEQRLTLTAILMGLAFLIVGIFSQTETHHDAQSSSQSNIPLIGQLVGVAMVSAQCALGEASLLALAGKLDAQEGRLLTSFSSGTGIAGPFGFLWKILWTEWVGFSLRFTCFLGALVLATSYHGLFLQFVRPALWITEHQEQQQQQEIMTATDDLYGEAEESEDPSLEIPMSTYHDNPPPDNRDNSNETVEDDPVSEQRQEDNGSPSGEELKDIAGMTGTERFRLVLSLWPFIVPLFTVYAAEYACEGGVWTAIGFGDDEESRNAFYERSNWLYQAGVFVSRSSGNWFSISLSTLWVLPGIQVVNLMLFYQIATQQWATFLYHPIPLYSLATLTGLLGGAVYVHGYQLVLKRVHPPSHTEFALSAVSMAESFGILVADIMSLFLQACLYEINGFPGAMVKCPGR